MKSAHDAIAVLVVSAALLTGAAIVGLLIAALLEWSR